MKVTVIQCPECNELVYSRARHDFRSCSCGTVSIDGGSDYTKVSYNPDVISEPVIKAVEIKATKVELYKDWNKRIDKFGIIKPSIVSKIV